VFQGRKSRIMLALINKIGTTKILRCMFKLIVGDGWTGSAVL
jgi:hypothetical protein